MRRAWFVIVVWFCQVQYNSAFRRGDASDMMRWQVRIEHYGGWDR